MTGTSANAVNMRNNYRWYILPNANPDGYEFTHTSVSFASLSTHFKCNNGGAL